MAALALSSLERPWAAWMVWAADYNYIQGMFLFERFQLFGIIGTAIVVAGPGLWLIQRRGRTVRGTAVSAERKPLNRGTIWASASFGIGWSIAECPGPSSSTSGRQVYALAALAGASRGGRRSGRCTLVLQVLLGFRHRMLPTADKTSSLHANRQSWTRNSKTVPRKQRSKVKSRTRFAGLDLTLTFDS